MQRTIPELDNLFRKAVAATRGRAAPVTSSEPVRPPSPIIRSAFTDVVSQLFHAEQATGRMCQLMAGRTGTPLSDILLRFQAGDETHHAELYESYLSRIGDIRPIDTRLSEALDAMCGTDLGPEAVLAAYNVVLEGEAVKLQQDCIERFTCPALTRITRAISQDEARHVAFGHAYLNGAFAGMSQEQRFGIYRHIHGCWEVAAAHPQDSGSLFSTILTRRRSDYMAMRWAHHDASLKRLGLIQASEQAPQ
jgi:hypothetical protein